MSSHDDNNMPHVSAIETACSRGEIPGAVVMAADATGQFQYARTFGQTAHGETLTVDSTMWIASAMKLMTAIAALQQVERGLVGLDDDLSALLPEAVKQDVLEGFAADGGPILKKKDRAVTLRLLLTHTNGQGHPVFEEELQRYLAWKKEDGVVLVAGTEIPDPRKQPLVDFLGQVPYLRQPGRSFMYGTGPDWAGKLVERLSGLSLEDYMRRNIWEPLGMQRVSHLPSHPAIRSHKVGMSILNEEGKEGKEGRLAPAPDAMFPFFQEGGLDGEAYGGATGWGSAESYMKVLQSLCANDGKVLGKEMADELFRPQLGAESKADLNHIIKKGDNAFRATLFAGAWTAAKQEFDHSLGGLIGLHDEPGRRRAGTMTWCGATNIWWFIDRESGLCGAYFCQLFPIANKQTIELSKIFEADMYRKYAESLKVD